MTGAEDPLSKEMQATFNQSSFHSGFLKLAILRMVSESPMHGYGMMKEIERISEHTWKPSPGSIYPALQELQRSGYILQETVGRKRVYRITERGDAILEAALSHVQRGVRCLNNLIDYKQS
ncbi:MAG: PadR family transcriptional regulator [Methanomassiliicoccus sp.]|nr:PadR family transcriptional regulator [Methanomassiliicoccus sp.]